MIKLRFTHTIESEDWGEHSDSTDCPCCPEIKYMSKDYIVVIHNQYYEFTEKSINKSRAV